MKYVIYDVKTKAYYCSLPTAHWSIEIVDALKFTSESKAKSYIDANFKNTNNQIENFKVVEFDLQQQTEIQDIDLTNVKNQINQVSDFLSQSKKYEYALLAKLSEHDKMQEDVLHKIEFMDIVDIYEAAALTKQLHEIRVHRREIKDALEFLHLFDNIDSKEYSLKLESRKYNPRILSNLFN